MANKIDFERLLKKAKGVVFLPSSSTNEPTVVGLLYDQGTFDSNTYNHFVYEYKSGIVNIQYSDKYLDMVIISTGDTFEIPNLKFRQSQFKQFAQLVQEIQLSPILLAGHITTGEQFLFSASDSFVPFKIEEVIIRPKEPLESSVN